MNEKSWVSTYLDYNGFKITVTEMGGTAEEALASLIELLDGVDAKPFLDRNNVMSLEDKIEAAVPTAQMVEDAFPKEPGYLGMKAEKLENINEGDSYDVVADTFSYDGTWVNFYSGNSEMSLAGHYYSSKVGQEIFNKMFDWYPVITERSPIPNGRKVLHIVGVKGKKSNDIYQNIKSVSDG